MAIINIIIFIIITKANSRKKARERMCSCYFLILNILQTVYYIEGWKLVDTYTRLCRVHSGCFKTSLIIFTPSSPKMLSAKHKCVSPLLLMRAKERSLQPATVRPQLSKLKEKHKWEEISHIPKFMLLFSFKWKLAGTYNPYTSTSSKLLKLWIPFQLCTVCTETKK